jgi:hypothetical protein
MSNSKEIISACILGLLLLLMFSTNPTEDKLKDYIKTSIKKEAIEEGGFAGAVNEIFAGPQASLMSITTQRKNCYLFSIYTVEGLEITHKYVGVFNTFFELPR